jgi:hypothetical protein
MKERRPGRRRREAPQARGRRGAEVATLRAYIAALGGRLELVADFGDERLSLA